MTGPDPRMALRSGFLPDRIVHLHPTLTCNLACSHCYSTSGPRQRGSLDLRELSRVLPLLAAEGYQLISLSGGEPLLYPHLGQLVGLATEAGFRVSMITNGVFPRRRYEALLGRLDAIAVSFDGMEETHNAIRGQARAFRVACDTLAWLAAEGQPVAAAISVTRNAIPELPDLVEHLVALGAGAVQVRPVAMAGRARSMESEQFMTEADRSRLYLVVLALAQELEGQAHVHCDLAPARGLWRQHGDYAALLGDCEREGAPAPVPLSSLVNPLIITETGRLKPIAYDFHPDYDLGELRSASLAEFDQIRFQRVDKLRQLVGSALAALADRSGVIDWFDHLARLSEAGVGPDTRAFAALPG